MLESSQARAIGVDVLSFRRELKNDLWTARVTGRQQLRANAQYSGDWPANFPVEHQNTLRVTS